MGSKIRCDSWTPGEHKTPESNKSVTALLGPDALSLSSPPGPDDLPPSLQSSAQDGNHRCGDQSIGNVTPSPCSARPSWCGYVCVSGARAGGPPVSYAFRPGHACVSRGKNPSYRDVATVSPVCLLGVYSNRSACVPARTNTMKPCLARSSRLYASRKSPPIWHSRCPSQSPPKG